MEKYVKLSDVKEMVSGAQLISDETESVGYLVDDINLERLPVADVVPVKHARWIQKEYWRPLAWDSSPLDWDNYDEKTHSEKDFCWHCSNCDYERSRSVEPKDRYCSNCGAKMYEE